MPHKLLSASIIICENILQEADNVMSAIRIVDLLKLRINPKLTLEEQAVPIKALVLIKSLPGDEEEHHIQVALVRPMKK